MLNWILPHSKKRELPDEPSKLIRVALRDLEKCENDFRYRVDMSFWHNASEETGVCSVCLAGATLAKTMGAPPGETVSVFLGGTNPGIMTKLLFLDSCRPDDYDPEYDTSSAYSLLMSEEFTDLTGEPLPDDIAEKYREKMSQIAPVNYLEHREEWFLFMHWFADLFEEEGY